MSERGLSLVNVSVTFGQVRALRDITATFNDGIVCLVGPNGSGKTTLLNAISGFVPLSGGSIILDGQRLDRRSPHDRSVAGVARSFQGGKVLDWATVGENVALGVRARSGDFRIVGGAANTTVDAEVKELVKSTGLEGRISSPASVLSFGERRLVELARLRAERPRLALLDEPVSGLHPGIFEIVRRILSELKQAGALLLIAEHDHSFVRAVADRVVILREGQIAADGDVSVLDDAARFFD